MIFVQPFCDTFLSYIHIRASSMGVPYLTKITSC